MGGPWSGGPISTRRGLVCRVLPAGCGHIAALGRRVPADRRADHPPRGAISATAAPAPSELLLALGPGAAVLGGRRRARRWNSFSEEFEHDVVRAGLLFFNGMREIDLQAPGFGHSIAAILAGRHKAQMCLGGSAGSPRRWSRTSGSTGERSAPGVQPQVDPDAEGAGDRRGAGRWRADRRPRPSRLRAEPSADFPGSAGRGGGTHRRRARALPASATTRSRRCSP